MKKISIFSIIIWLGIIGFIGYSAGYILLIIVSPLIFFMVMDDLIIETFERNLKCFVVREAVKICNNIILVSVSFIMAMYLVLIGSHSYPLKWITLSIALLVTIYTCVYIFVVGRQMRTIVKKDQELYKAASKLVRK